MIEFLSTSGDLTVAFVIAVIAMLVSVAVAEIGHVVVFHRHGGIVEAHTRLLDIVHTSLLAFIAFMLAISVSGVQGNLGKADDGVSREGSHIATLDRDLRQLEAPWAEAIRGELHRYVDLVATEEWASLARAEPALSRNAQEALNGIRLRLRSPEIDAGNRRTLIEHFDRLEEDRAGRYESATRSIPRIFWILIDSFLIGAMVMNGRFRPTPLTRGLVALHFAAIGLCVAMILIIDAPFRGQTSISPAAIVNAVRPK